MGHEPGTPDYIAQWTRDEIAANSTPSSAGWLKRTVASLAVVVAVGGAAWGAYSWREGSASSTNVASASECEPSSVAWRRACHRPGSEPAVGAACEPSSAAWRIACQRPAATLASPEDGPASTGSIEKTRKRTVVARGPAPDAANPRPQPQAAEAPAQAEAANPPIASRVWTDPDPNLETAQAAASPELAPVILPPVRPVSEALRPRIPERDARPKPQRLQVAESEEAAPPKPRVPERQAARPKPKPAPLLAEAEEEPSPAPHKARSVKPARTVVARAAEEEPVVNRPLRRRSVSAASLRERRPEPRLARVEIRPAREIVEMEVEVRDGLEPVMRRRGSPIWVVDAERRRGTRPNEFPSEFVHALQHYNMRYSMQSGW